LIWNTARPRTIGSIIALIFQSVGNAPAKRMVSLVARWVAISTHPTWISPAASTAPAARNAIDRCRSVPWAETSASPSPTPPPRTPLTMVRLRMIGATAAGPNRRCTCKSPPSSATTQIMGM